MPNIQKGSAGYKKTLLKEGSTVGANATIVCGHTIGKWAMIAAGAVVTKNVKNHALMAGVPAKRIGWVCECGNVLGKDLKCECCHREYEEHTDGLKLKNINDLLNKYMGFCEYNGKECEN